MPKMIMDRDFTVRSTTGHIIGFSKGVPMGVPPALVAECTKFGAALAKGEEAPKTAKEIKEDPVGEERATAIDEAVETMFIRNNRGDFNGSGYPDAKALTAEAGFKVDVKERDAAWDKFKKAQNVENGKVAESNVE